MHIPAAPELQDAAQKVAMEVGSWNGVVSKGRRSAWRIGHEQEIDGVGFYVGDIEFGHIHLNSAAHIMLPPPVADSLAAAKVVRGSSWAHGQVEMAIRNQEDIGRAVMFFRLSYEVLSSGGGKDQGQQQG